MKSSRTLPAPISSIPAADRVLEWIASIARQERGRVLVIAQTTAMAGAVLFLAGVLRFWMLAASGLSGDEAVYAGQAAVLAGDGDLGRYFVLMSRGNSNFLLFQYLVAGLFYVFGVNDLLPRVVSAVLSTLTVAVAFELGRTLYDRRVAVGGAILLAVSGYAVTLGRLALLDSALSFFFALAMLFAAKWIRSHRPIWLYAFAGAAALAIQTKVTGVLVLAIVGLYLLASGRIRDLRPRDWIDAAGVFAVFMAPALLQLAANPGLFLALLGDSTRRISDVASEYYFVKLASYEGLIFPVLWVATVIAAARWRAPGDALLMGWILVGSLFFQLYPLKAYNYLLPVMPAFALIAARVLVSACDGLVARLGIRSLRVAAPVIFGLLVASQLVPVSQTLASEQKAGIREAADWLASNTQADAGVMTISQGSAQYAISFYAKRDAYPFGRFRLATVMPGGSLLQPQLSSSGSPRDWVIYWPPRLIQTRVVSYLVFSINQPDDPPDDPFVATETQRQFRSLIEAYGGRLVYTVYSRHEPTVWIYKVSKLLPNPVVHVSGTRPGPQATLDVRVEGEGYTMDSMVTLYYHQTKLGVFATDGDGRFSTNVRLPAPVRTSYQLIAVDATGNRSMVTGLKTK